MRPLTYVVPKCLLPVGGRPLIERTIAYLKGYGVEEFVLCVSYLKGQVMDAIGGGERLGVRVTYAESEVPMGTAGQLKTAERHLEGRFLAMNGDIVTDLNIFNLVKAHRRKGGIATIAVKRFGVNIPYGHITVDKASRITAFVEKPTISYVANAGIYVMEKRLLDRIPRGKPSSLEKDIFPSLLSGGERVNAYFEEANWADVGSMADFERVNDQALSPSGWVRPPGTGAS
jgi:NDP-sugar pyrophosphorylase family protein